MHTFFHFAFRYLFSLGLLLCLSNFHSQAQAIIPLIEGEEVIKMGKRVLVFEDKNKQQSLSTIQQLPDKSFIKSKHEVPNFNITTSAMWVKLKVQSQDDNKWFLQIPYPLLNYVDIYVVDSLGKVQEQHTGLLQPYANKGFRTNFYVCHLNINKQEKKTVYIRVESYTSMQLPVVLLTDTQLLSHNHDTDIFAGLFYGFVLLMTLYNLFIYLVVRDKTYLLYVLYVVCSAINSAYMSGYGFDYIWTKYPYFNGIPMVYSAMIGVAAVMFTTSFLNLRKEFPKIYRTFVVGAVIYASFAIIDFLGIERHLALTILQLFVLILCLTVLFSSYYVYFKGFKIAKFYALAWTFFITGVIIFILKDLTILPTNSFTNNSINYGTMFEVLFLSFALADRISTYRKEKEIAQKQFIASVQENERIILEQNQILEHKVKERTIQLASTNEELNTSNEELQTTLETVQEQSRIIAKKNKDITSSITYAKRIQEAMLPSFSLIKKHIPEVFVLFKPRDVVSGDFYYFDNQEHINIIAVVDCTGHGVPGAFMSMIGNDILNTIIHDKEILQPNKILYWLDILIRKALKQNENENRDGMDMTICTINTENKEIQYSGAMNPLYYWQENTATLQEIKATKKPIGGKILNNDEFILHNISYQSVENTVLYLCTDGFQDQFGGKDNKKFMTKRFKELLLSIAHLPILEQGKILDATITEWIGHRDQTDDITVMGIKI